MDHSYNKKSVENYKSVINNQEIFYYIAKSEGSSENYKYSLDVPTIATIDSEEECAAAVETLRWHCREYNVLGIDWKWETDELELASPGGFCVLIKQPLLKWMPIELEELLKDEGIFKVGAEPYAGDYEVLSTLCVGDLFQEFHPLHFTYYPYEEYSKVVLQRIGRSQGALELFHKFQENFMPKNQYFGRSFCVNLFIYQYCLKYLSGFGRCFVCGFFTKLIFQNVRPKQHTFRTLNFQPLNTYLWVCRSCIPRAHQLNLQFYSSHVSSYPMLTRYLLQQHAHYENPLANQKICIVNSEKECENVAEILLTHCEEYSVLGFDCEWVENGKVALLQLTSNRGLCALIRLSKFQMIPSILKEILEDDRILKVGVQPHCDAEKLLNDFGVNVSSTLDLRRLASICNPHHCHYGLGKLSSTYLNIELKKKHSAAFHQRWEDAELSEEHLIYAANDAHVGIALFKRFQDILKKKNNFHEYCLGHLNERCVVCGSASTVLFRKYIIPDKFRKHISIGAENYVSQSTLLLCKPCRDKSEVIDSEINGKLSEIYANISDENIVKAYESSELDLVEFRDLWLKHFINNMKPKYIAIIYQTP